MKSNTQWRKLAEANYESTTEALKGALEVLSEAQPTDAAEAEAKRLLEEERIASVIVNGLQFLMSAVMTGVTKSR